MLFSAFIIQCNKWGRVPFFYEVHYDKPDKADDPLLGLDNVLLTPHIAGGPRVNPAGDSEEIVLSVWSGVRKRRAAPDRKRTRRGKS